MLITKKQHDFQSKLVCTTQQHYLISMDACWKIVCGKTTWNPPQRLDFWLLNMGFIHLIFTLTWILYRHTSHTIQVYIYILIYIYIHPTIAHMYVYIYVYIFQTCIHPFFPTSQAIQPITPAVAMVHESSVICKARQKRSKATVTRWDSCSNSTKPEGPLGWPRSVPRSTKVSPESLRVFLGIYGIYLGFMRGK